MKRENEVMVSRTGEQAFLEIASMVTGKKEVDASTLVFAIQHFKKMYDVTVQNVERMEAEEDKGPF